MKALVLAPFSDFVLDKLRQSLDVTYENWMDTKKLLSSDEFVERIQGQDTEIIVIEADFMFREVFEKAPKLKFLGVCRADVTHVDLDAATEHGVPVVNTPARNDVAVAELALGLMLAVSRHIPAAHDMVSSRSWVDPTAAYFTWRGTELTGKTVGIVGFGAIGRKVAKMLRGFETKVLVYDPFVAAEPLRQSGAEAVELDELMARSDIVTVHCSITPDSMGLISEQKIALMKPTAYLVNAASTFVIDMNAIVDALQNKRIAGAAFDVFETWPVKADSPLLDLENVVLTPHIGGATFETVVRYSQMMADDIERFMRGERPKNLVNTQMGD
jgi:D-3-phosphoglycerate dehydrogenase